MEQRGQGVSSTMKRKHQRAVSIGQDNDARCFNADSKHNKRAKRLASKRLRRILKADTDSKKWNVS